MNPPAATRASRPPIRTCVGCRATVPQAELVRVAVVDGRAVADPRRRLPGRGAYLHARPACLAAAGKGLARSLKRAVGKAELEGLGRVILPAGTGGSVVTDARRDRADAAPAATPPAATPPAGPAGDPGVISPGMADAEAVEIGSPSSTRTMSNPRPTSLPNVPTSGGAERSH